jgi:HK97 family phage major capsid protein
VYQDWLNRYPGGGPSVEGRVQSEPVPATRMGDFMGLRSATVKARALLTSVDTSAGDLTTPLHRGLIEPGLTRPLTVRDLVTVVPVQTDAIEYVKETSRVQAADVVAEATALTGTSGTKPEGGLVFDVVQDTVKTFAEWIPATKRILQDAVGLQSYINAYLVYDLARKLEDEILAGSGAGEHFRGVLNTPGIQTQTVQANENNFDSLRRAKAKIQLVARTSPTAVIMHPNDAAELDISKSGAAASPYNYWGAGPYAAVGPVRLWGVPVIESDAIAENTALVGDFAKAILYDRESTTISVGTAGDDFVRNIVRILSELRAGFGVIRPTAFVTVSLT